MQIKFLTWNIKKNINLQFYKHLNNYLNAEQIDILVLQECPNSSALIINQNFKELIDISTYSGKDKVRIFINQKNNNNIHTSNFKIFNKDKLKCVKIEINNLFIFNLAAVHFYSKLKENKVQEDIDFINKIKEYELANKNQMTILVGDFNYSPFNSNLRSHFHLNSLNNKNLINNLKYKLYQGTQKRFFYNPMWNLLGDYDYVKKTNKVNGSFYFIPKKEDEFHWNLIDGLIISDEMKDKLIIESLEIITNIDNQPLLTNKIKKNNDSFLNVGFSDHLPIKFSIEVN